MKLEVCYITDKLSARTVCEEIYGGVLDSGQIYYSLLNRDKPPIRVFSQNLIWIRPYEAPKRVRKAAQT
jgi:hypothetical protein